MRHFTRKLLAGCAVSALLLAASAASADYNAAAPAGDWYWGLSGDLTWLHSDMGGGGNIDVGYRFWPSDFGDFRIEAEAGYHDIGGDTAAHYFTYMGNLYYDFNNMHFSSGSDWKVVPYIGGGLGDATVSYQRHENDFAYQGMAGLTFVSASNPNMDWSLGYRYQGADGSPTINANSVELGLRFHF